MNRDQIIQQARKYGCVIAEDGPDSQCEVCFSADQIVAMVRAAQAAERESCAQLCEIQDPYVYSERTANACAAAIRQRGKPMNRDDIIQMAREAGIYDLIADGVVQWHEIVHLVNLVAQHEREQCAKVCEQQDEEDTQYRYDYRRGVLDCVDAIKSRNKE